VRHIIKDFGDDNTLRIAVYARGIVLDWKLSNGKLLPNRTDLPPAPMSWPRAPHSEASDPRLSISRANLWLFIRVYQLIPYTSPLKLRLFLLKKTNIKVVKLVLSFPDTCNLKNFERIYFVGYYIFMMWEPCGEAFKYLIQILGCFFYGILGDFQYVT